jgi:hypothetical protein
VLPEKHETDLLPGHRLMNETINAGISWQPVPLLTWFGDLRNISEENSPAFMEPHFGMELIPWRHIALRAGYYYEKGEGNCYSFGLGVLDINDLHSLTYRTKNHEYLIDYGFSISADEVVVHSLALHFRI